MKPIQIFINQNGEAHCFTCRIPFEKENTDTLTIKINDRTEYTQEASLMLGFCPYCNVYSIFKEDRKEG